MFYVYSVLELICQKRKCIPSILSPVLLMLLHLCLPPVFLQQGSSCQKISMLYSPAAVSASMARCTIIYTSTFAKILSCSSLLYVCVHTPFGTHRYFNVLALLSVLFYIFFLSSTASNLVFPKLLRQRSRKGFLNLIFFPLPFGFFTFLYLYIVHFIV